MAEAANNRSRNSKIYLCDTFEGVVKAGDNDAKYVNGEHADTSRLLVENLLNDLKIKNVNILKGVFPDDTGEKVNSNKFKFCHIDVDVYQGAHEITDWIWSKLVVGGLIVYDDYGFSNTTGVTKFVDEQRSKHDRTVFHNLNGHGIIIKLQ